jgi:hypothetical protein
MIGYEDLTWNGNELRHRGRTLATIEPDAEWPNLWRVRRPDGDLTDMVNLTRAKDAQVSRPRHFQYPREARGKPQDSLFRAGGICGYPEHMRQRKGPRAESMGTEPFQGGHEYYHQ